MSLLVESIKILNGRCYLLALHEARMRKAQSELYGIQNSIHLHKYIQIPEVFKEGLVKCRIEYDTQIRDVQFLRYSVRTIRNAKTVVSDEINYPYKFVNRPQLDALFSLRENCDEIIIIKNGLVTDAYYYNLVFEKEKRFYTPAIPLLKGIQRENLLNCNKIISTDIPADHIHNYESIHFINALTKLNKCTILPSQIR